MASKSDIQNSLSVQFKSKGAAALQSNINKTTKAVETTGKKGESSMKGLAAASQGAGKSVTGLGQSMANSLDPIDKAFAGTDKLMGIVGKLGAVGALAGIAVTGLTMIYKALVTDTDSAANAQTRLSESLADIGIASKAAEDAIADIGKATDLTVASMDAMEIVQLALINQSKALANEALTEELAKLIQVQDEIGKYNDRITQRHELTKKYGDFDGAHKEEIAHVTDLLNKKEVKREAIIKRVRREQDRLNKNIEDASIAMSDYAAKVDMVDAALIGSIESQTNFKNAMVATAEATRFLWGDFADEWIKRSDKTTTATGKGTKAVEKRIGVLGKLFKSMRAVGSLAAEEASDLLIRADASITVADADRKRYEDLQKDLEGIGFTMERLAQDQTSWVSKTISIWGSAYGEVRETFESSMFDYAFTRAGILNHEEITWVDHLAALANEQDKSLTKTLNSVTVNIARREVERTSSLDRTIRAIEAAGRVEMAALKKGADEKEILMVRANTMMRKNLAAQSTMSSVQDREDRLRQDLRLQSLEAYMQASVRLGYQESQALGLIEMERYNQRTKAAAEAFEKETALHLRALAIQEASEKKVAFYKNRRSKLRDYQSKIYADQLREIINKTDAWANVEMGLIQGVKNAYDDFADVMADAAVSVARAVQLSEGSAAENTARIAQAIKDQAILMSAQAFAYSAFAVGKGFLFSDPSQFAAAAEFAISGGLFASLAGLAGSIESASGGVHAKPADTDPTPSTTPSAESLGTGSGTTEAGPTTVVVNVDGMLYGTVDQLEDAMLRGVRNANNRSDGPRGSGSRRF